MNNRDDVNNIFRPSDSPLTEHEKEQIALRKNLERLRAKRLAREAASRRMAPGPSYGARPRRTMPSEDPGQDRALAPDAQEPYPA